MLVPPCSSMTHWPVGSAETSRIAWIWLARCRRGKLSPASIMRSTRWAEPTLSSVVASLIVESPTMTCRRR